MWNREYILFPLLSIPLLFSKDSSLLLFLLSIILILLRVKVKKIIRARGIRDNLSGALRDWAVAVLTRSAITVLFERCRIIHERGSSFGQRNSIFNLRREIKVLEQLQSFHRNKIRGTASGLFLHTHSASTLSI